MKMSFVPLLVAGFVIGAGVAVMIGLIIWVTS